MNRFWKFVVLIALLTSSAFAAFVQSPIPPSSRENFLQDSDGDGRLDYIALKFLGAISQEYIDQMVDSLTMDWLDSAGLVQHYVLDRKLVKLDPEYNRRAKVDLSSMQNGFALLTEINSVKGDLGNVKMFLHDGTVFDVPVKDRMAPVISETFLKSYRGTSNDTLTIKFSERVIPSPTCEAMLESRTRNDSLTRLLTPIAVLWNANKTSAQFIFEGKEDASDVLTPRDSIRLTPKCFVDSAGRNPSADFALFKEVAGFFPLELLTTNMVYGEQSGSSSLPIFQMLFEDVDASVPNEHNWGIAMDVLGPEFENAIRDALGLDHKKLLDLSKLKICLNLRIYTNLGVFVVATSDEIYGDDPRFEGRPTRLFLKWNLMDGGRRRVGTGAYISNAAIVISYDGQVVYRSDVHHGPTTQAFGVKRR